MPGLCGDQIKSTTVVVVISISSYCGIVVVVADGSNIFSLWHWLRSQNPQ